MTTIYNLNQIINKIQFERNIFRFVIIKAYNSNESCLSDEDIRWLSANNTVKLLTAHSDGLDSSNGVNDNMLLIRCLPEHFEPELFKQMVSYLEDKRHARILFIWNLEYTTASMEMRREFQHQQQLLFEYCAEMRLINVIGIYRDYASDGHFYTYSYFPEFNLQRKTLNDKCFPDRVRDLKGFAIRTIADQIEPWSIVWRNQYGHVEIGGLLINILREFALRNNGTLHFPYATEPNDFAFSVQWLEFLQNDTLDIVAGLASNTMQIYNMDFSATLQITDWLIMLPLPPLVPDGEVLWFLLNSVLGLFLILLLFVFSFVFTVERALKGRISPINAVRFFLSILINSVLRSVIGQPSFISVHATERFLKRFLYVFLLLSGIFVSTYISAGIQSYSTSKPPQHPRIGNFNELLQSKIPVKISQFEYQILTIYMGQENIEMLKEIFMIESSFDNYQHDRLSMDTRFGYTLLSPVWSIVSRYQSFLPKPLFYLAEEVDLKKCIPMSIPLQKHSIFRESLNNMIHQLKSVGLIDLWTQQAYKNMVSAKKLNITTLKPVRWERLYLEDLYGLWWLSGIGVILSILVFCAELWYYKKSTQVAVDEQMDLCTRLREGLQRKVVKRLVTSRV